MSVRSHTLDWRVQQKGKGNRIVAHGVGLRKNTCFPIFGINPSFEAKVSEGFKFLPQPSLPSPSLNFIYISKQNSLQP